MAKTPFSGPPLREDVEAVPPTQWGVGTTRRPPLERRRLVMVTKTKGGGTVVALADQLIAASIVCRCGAAIMCVPAAGVDIPSSHGRNRRWAPVGSPETRGHAPCPCSGDA